MGLSAGLRNGMLNSALTQQRQMLQEKIKQQEALKTEVKDVKKAFENNDDAFSAFDENNQESSATISTKDIPTETILANSGVTINKPETEETNNKTETKPISSTEEKQKQEEFNVKLAETEASVKKTIEDSQKELDTVKEKIKNLEDEYSLQLATRRIGFYGTSTISSAIEKNGNIKMSSGGLSSLTRVIVLKDKTTNPKNSIEKVKEYEELIGQAQALQATISVSTWQTAKLEDLKERISSENSTELPTDKAEELLEKIKNKSNQLQDVINTKMRFFSPIRQHMFNSIIDSSFNAFN